MKEEEKQPTDIAQDAITHLLDYVENEKKIVTLQLIKSSSIAGGNVVAFLVLFFIGTMVYCFANILLAVWLGQLLNKWFMGFAAVTVINLFLLLMLIVFKQSLLVRPIQNLIIRLTTK
ncbi:MAG: hypothetical protein MUC81_13235 [Bacteroidia bacterium]|jgi:hypothetical protein|nr:hypothetical protein [Bacteroidia bacterium]